MTPFQTACFFSHGGATPPPFHGLIGPHHRPGCSPSQASKQSHPRESTNSINTRRFTASAGVVVCSSAHQPLELLRTLTGITHVCARPRPRRRDARGTHVVHTRTHAYTYARVFSILLYMQVNCVATGRANTTSLSAASSASLSTPIAQPRPRQRNGRSLS